jgi:hypothetical protein
MGEIMRFDRARAVDAGFELGYACSVDIEPDHRRALAAEGDGDWQPDISEADDGEHSTVRHNLTLYAVRLKVVYLEDSIVRDGCSALIK